MKYQIRREIFHALLVDATVLPITLILNQFNISRQGVTKDIKTLENAGLVQINTKERERYCLADAEPLNEVNKRLKFYEQFWGNALGDLGSYSDNKP